MHVDACTALLDACTIISKMSDIFDAALGLEEHHVKEGYAEGLT
jgi:hypothetical protein